MARCGSNGDPTTSADQPGDVGDTADVGVAVLFRESQTLAKVFADLVAVKNLDVSLPLA
jgi:hypothetical protein